MVGKNKDKECLICSISSIEQDRLEEGKAILSYPFCNEGLRCTRCGGHACTNCLRGFIEAHSAAKCPEDRWCTAVDGFLQTGKVPVDFVGHCCELTVELKELERLHGNAQRRLDEEAVPSVPRLDGHLGLKS